MLVWRLALGRYKELDGEGARLYGGRWNSPGTAMVYAATHIALALLEQLVHVSPTRLPGSVAETLLSVAASTPLPISRWMISRQRGAPGTTGLRHSVQRRWSCRR